MRDRRHGLLRRGTPAALLLLALTGCGTTVPLAQQSLSGSGGSGLGTVDPLTGEVVPSAGAGTAPTTGAEALDGSTGGVVAGGSGAAVTGTGGTSGSVTPGATALPGKGAVGSGGTVQVGVTYFKDASAGLAAIGASGGTLGDQAAYAKIVIDDANAHGGLGGKKIEPVYFAFDANPGADSIPDQENQACAKFTQDNHVQLAITETAGPELISCLRKKGVPMVGENSITGASASRYTAGGLVDLGAFNLDRRAVEQVKVLSQLGYFAGWNTSTGSAGPAPVKIGVITYDYPDWRDSVNGPMTSALQAAGYAKPVVVAVAPHSSYDNLTKMSGQLQSAVLQFKASGVTHVLVWDDNGVSTLFFMKNADGQSYRPRYGINSGNNMVTLTSTGLVPASQVTGSVGMGWIPAQDLLDADGGPRSKYSNPARRACDALMAKHDQSGSKYNEFFALKYCGAMSAMKAAADRGGVVGSSFLAAAETLGSSVLDPITPATFIGRGQRDGNGGIYHYAYDAKAAKMVYTSGIVALAHG